MVNIIVLTLLADDELLRAEIIQQLAPFAEMHETPSASGPSEVKLVIEIISGHAGVLTNAAAIAAFILLLKNRRKQHRPTSRIEISRLGESGFPLDNIDEATVRRIIGLGEVARP